MVDIVAGTVGTVVAVDNLAIERLHLIGNNIGNVQRTVGLDPARMLL